MLTARRFNDEYGAGQSMHEPIRNRADRWVPIGRHSQGFVLRNFDPAIVSGRARRPAIQHRGVDRWTQSMKLSDIVRDIGSDDRGVDGARKLLMAGIFVVSFWLMRPKTTPVGPLAPNTLRE